MLLAVKILLNIDTECITDTQFPHHELQVSLTAQWAGMYITL